MENLQTEVLEIEFNEFSKGLPAITELDFAKILLRYTYLQSDQYEMYLERLLDRIPEGRGITFTEFKSFCQFLNTLDDFAIAMRMYTLADQPISQEEFHRAVKICTGTELSPHIVDTVFKIFDDDGDGQLSYKEFIAIMRDRLHRGFKHTSRSEGWDAFKQCVKSEMKAVV
ncbi:putative calcium uptake protein 3, mitochondrial isoform X1 [Penaeus vannamei]|uniref:Putative calcium uptake protein 3, mitochondrial isoform X1 n=2 Tax=Penaeus vannamei TaxID=6689 RepID=A0A423T6L2_PENVA|nr:putative calcium uptake protein 3, mitochondrial isoform X1 [Penaeus vannamei]